MTMRTRIFDTATLIAIMMITLVPIGHVRADPLPNSYLGRWCFDGETAFPVTTKKEWNECRDGDGYAEIRRDGYSMHEQECKYVSIKHTGEKLPASTKPRKEDWIPVIRILARCKGEGETWKEQLELSYRKGMLTLNAKRVQ